MRKPVYSFLVWLSQSESGISYRDFNNSLDSYQISQLKSKKLVVAMHGSYFITDAGREVISKPCNYERFLEMVAAEGRVRRTDLMKKMEDARIVNDIKTYALDHGFRIEFTERNWVLLPEEGSS